MSASTLGKPGVPLPEGLFPGEKADAESQPWLETAPDPSTGERTVAALVVPVNNPYWRRMSWELGSEPSALHAVAHAAKHLTANVYAKIGEEGIDQLWFVQLAGMEPHAWTMDRARRLGCSVVEVLARAGMSKAAMTKVLANWAGIGSGAGTVAGESTGEAG